MKIDQYRTTTDPIKNKNNASKNVAALNQGDKFKATILDIKRNEVVIKLSDGSILTAKSLVIPQAHIGDNMEFMVQNNSDGQILLTMLAGDTKQQELSMFSNILLSANIMPSEEAMNVIKALMDHEIPIDKSTIEQAIHMLKKNPELDMGTLAFLLKEDIPITIKNIELVKNMVGNESQIKNQIDQLSWKLTAIDEPNLRDQILQIFLPEADLAHESRESNDNVLRQNTTLAQQDIALKIETNSSKAVFMQATNSIINDSDIMHEIIDQLKNTENIRTGEEFKAIVDILTNKYPESLKLLSAINYEKLLPYFNEFLEKLVELEKVKTEIKPEVLSKAIKDSLFIDIKNPEHEESINDYYNKLYEKISKAVELTKSSESINTREANAVLNEIKDNIEFTNNINKFQEFIQIPFKLNDKNNQGDLYIFNDKKGKKISKDKASVLLALDLKVLGHFEAFIQKDYKNISCQFRTMDKKVQGLIQVNLPKLEIALKQKGYNLSQIMYKTIEEPFNVLQKLDETGFDTKNQQSQVKRYSFDMRA
jgi:hypothetical protein